MMMSGKKSIEKSLDRRDFIKTFGLTAAGSILFNLHDIKGFTQQGGKPNIIFIMADDLGYGDLGCYGQTKIKTPYLDKMALEGMKFTSAYSGSPVCAPSRSCLMTGQHTGHTTVRENKSGITDERVPLNKGDKTVAEVLKEAGYTTGMIGKWGLGEPGNSGEPNRQGYDYFFGYLNQNHAHYYYPEYLWRNSEKVYIPENKNGNREVYSHDLFAQESIKFIEKNKDNPFFLYIPFTIPHAELLVPENSMKDYDGKFVEDKPFINEKGKNGYATQMKPHAAYAAMISRMDKDIGNIFKKLKDLGIDDNTIVFFTSDNGPSDAGGIDAEFFNSTGPLRGAKHDLYEGGIRVPMIVRWPGKIAANSNTDQPFAFWDFLPTAAEIAKSNVPSKIDGISIAPTLFNGNQKQHKYYYWEYRARKKNFLQAVRFGNWKAVRMNPGDEIELYNLKNDLAEKNNVASEHPDLIAKAETYFLEAHTESVHWPMKIID